jgi:hypothetical protein
MPSFPAFLEFQEKASRVTRVHEIAENLIKGGLLKKVGGELFIFKLAQLPHFVTKPENKCS